MKLNELGWQTKEVSQLLDLKALPTAMTGCGARDQFACWTTGTSSGNWKKKESSMFLGGMPLATTSSPKPFFRAPWRVSDAVVGRENAGWTAPTNGHPCPFQICSQGPPAEKTGRGFLLNRSPCSPHDPIGQVTELNWTEQQHKVISGCANIRKAQLPTAGEACKPSEVHQNK